MTSPAAAPVTFTKMHGLGNDFIFIDTTDHPIILTPDKIQKLADRQRGIGCDQLIVIEPPHHPKADVFMRIFNADGSEVGACGNATRCLGGLLSRKTGQDRHVIETKTGLLRTLTTITGIEVNMGPPILAWDQIPLRSPVDPLFLPIHVMDFDLPAAVSMGNPHLVFFVHQVAAVDVHHLGQELTRHPLFPEGANVEFVEIIDRQRIRMRVWERGTGVTQSCASGACAVVVAGVLRGLLDPHVSVHLDGGYLKITYDQTVMMTGPITFVFSGVLDTQCQL